MKNRHFVALLGTLALVAVGCQTRIPDRVYYHDKGENRLASVKHWDDMAIEASAQIAQMGLLPSQTSLEASSGQHQVTTSDGEIVVFGDVNLKPSEQIPVSIKVTVDEQADKTPFSDLYIKMLNAELIKPSIGFITPIKNQTDDEGQADYLCKIETHLVRHGVVEHGGLFDSTADSFWANIASRTSHAFVGGLFGNPKERYEVLVITSLYSNQDKTARLVAAVKQIVYVGSEDLELYEGHGLTGNSFHIQQIK